MMLNRLHFRNTVVVLLVLYILTALGLWLSINLATYGAYYNSIQRYSKTYEDELSTELFEGLFSDAKACAYLEGSPNRLACERGIIKRLAGIIHTDEFYQDITGNDLFIVVQEKEEFFKLGWEGKWHSITTEVDQDLLNSKFPQWFNFLFRQCHAFDLTTGIANKPEHVCEVYYPIDLGQEKYCYIIRFISLNEELNLIFWFFWPAWLVLFMN